MPSSIHRLLVAVIVSLAAPRASVLASSAYSSWSEIAPSGPSVGRLTGHVGISDHDSDSALIFGGHNGDRTRSTNEVWMFSFHGKSWQKIAPTSTLPLARHDHCGTACPSDSSRQALFFGGASNNGSLLNDVWALSLGSTYTWRHLPPSSPLRPSSRAQSACACINASFFVVFGGRDFLGASGEIWLMNLLTNTWIMLQSTSPMPGPLFGSCIHTLSHSRVFVFGGIDSQNVASNDAWILDVNVSQLGFMSHKLRSNSIPSARGFHGCIGAPAASVEQISHTVYIRGGIGSGETRYDNILQDMWSCSLIFTLEEINFHCRPVVFLSALPLCSQCVSVMIASIVLVHGGVTVGGKLSSETNLLYLTDMRVESVQHPSQDVPSARSGAVVTHFTNTNAQKFMFLHGGINSNGTLLDDTWLLDIAISR
jgi:hypothetical protein